MTEASSRDHFQLEKGHFSSAGRQVENFGQKIAVVKELSQKLHKPNISGKVLKNCSNENRSNKIRIRQGLHVYTVKSRVLTRVTN